MGRPRKRTRKFYGNRFSQSSESPQPSTSQSVSGTSEMSSTLTASSSKLNLSTTQEQEGSLFGNRIMSILNLVGFIQQLSCCICQEIVRFSDEQLTGEASELSFTCGCDTVMKLPSSDVSTNSRHHQVNDRLQMAVFELGCHYEDARSLCANLDLPPPVSCQSWNLNKNRIHAAFEQEATKSKKRAAEEIKQAKGNDVTVSCDGTWQKRGFSSKNGVVTVATVNGLSSKIIDTETLTNHCSKCKQKNTVAHVCLKNFEGHAGSMEGEGVQRIFRRSQQKFSLSYTGYLGDGDSKSLKKLADAEPPIYPGKTLSKLECVGHIQKRMGRKLTNLVTACKNKVYKRDNGKKVKGIGGMKKLTQKEIYRIQGHYGAAIRKNAGNEAGMRKAVWAIFHHRNGNHDMCGEWCPSKKGDVTKANARVLPGFIMKEIKSVFESLTSTELLSRCTHGGTQNVNESFHHVIWALCPKEVFVGLKRLDLAVNSAVLQYNEGKSSKLAVFPHLGILEGKFTKLYYTQIDNKRIKRSAVTKDAKAKRQKKQEETRSMRTSEEYGPGLCENTE